MAPTVGGADAPLLAVIAAGGGIGAVLRYGVGLWVPSHGDMPWPTLGINVIGCFAIGVLMVVITEIRTPHRLLRPFLGVGVLGGFTTFSTYAVEVRRLLESGRTVLALGYLGGTVVLALGAVVAGMAVTRWFSATARRFGGTR